MEPQLKGQFVKYGQILKTFSQQSVKKQQCCHYDTEGLFFCYCAAEIFTEVSVLTASSVPSHLLKPLCTERGDFSWKMYKQSVHYLVF